MADTYTSLSSSSSEQFRLVALKLSTSTDESIKRQVQQTHKRTGYAKLLRQPLLVPIQKILKPTTVLIDSILLDKKVPESKIVLETSNPLEFDSALYLIETSNDSNASLHTVSTSHQMEEIADKAAEMLDKINVHLLSMDVLHQFGPGLSWDAKAVKVMGSFVFKFVEFLVFLLVGPGKPLSEFESLMATLKENPVSLVGSQLEKFQKLIDQLNSVIKITLEMIEYICDLTLLSDTEYSNEYLLSTGVYWTILSVVACYIQINVLMENGEVALELSHLISNLSQILNDLKHHYTICKPQIEEMEAHIQSNALFDDIFCTRKESSDAPTDISELMKRLTYSKDGHQSLIDGSTMSKVDIEVLKEKTVLLLISDLDIPPEEIKSLLKIYEEIREEDYYKIVWIPFVLKWTEELREKFENLKSKMPWYTVCYDSPITGLWYFKGRWTSKLPLVFLINPLGRMEEWPASIAEIRIYTDISSKRIMIEPFVGADLTTARTPHPELHINESVKGRTKRSQKGAARTTHPELHIIAAPTTHPELHISLLGAPAPTTHPELHINVQAAAPTTHPELHLTTHPSRTRRSQMAAAPTTHSKLYINESVKGRTGRSQKAAAPTTHPELHINELAKGRTKRRQKALSWFQGLFSQNRRGNEKRGSSRII